ncbi:MAG: hypothetical protein LKI93_03880 [Bifidobacteriaceae bacterium]|jgi:hypothetical protein|nr:hypothetical protein [Bifidobacteriaceae bacterium]MCI1914417.1 hypothetical protein [Bifidobacteriaceae bacterium]MCI1935869.1 hypothetical protein [Bifidobacteriaceae bacterium]
MTFILLLSAIVVLAVIIGVLRVLMLAVGHPIIFLFVALRFVARLIGGIALLIFVLVLFGNRKITDLIGLGAVVIAAGAVSSLIDRWLYRPAPAEDPAPPNIEVHYHYDAQPEHGPEPEILEGDIISSHDEQMR